MRHRIEYVGGVEQLRLPVRRHILALLFLPFWLTGWTIGGADAITEVMDEPNLFLAVWLCGWAFGWVAAASAFAAMLVGSEILRVQGGDLEVIHRIGPLRRSWRYRGGEIRHLSRCYEDDGFFTRGRGWVPLLSRPARGEVAFDYGSDRIFIAMDATGNDGDAIEEWLTARLPRSASAA
ncbi:hypothetical protein OF829_02305 [Sphingomonas sp. LB-2]|nr:hypothetical protein [Sphingomonas caeni]